MQLQVAGTEWGRWRDHDAAPTGYRQTLRNVFELAGRDVHLDLAVAPWEAALGATVTLPTLGGEVEFKIPEGSQTGTRLRLRGRGLPGAPAGDQNVELEIRTPTAETNEARALYERMKQEMAFDPRAGLGSP